MASTTWRKRMLTITGLVGAGALAVAGCSSSSSTASSGSSASSGKVPLVVYSAQGYDHAMAAAFQKATGIAVKLDDNSTGPGEQYFTKLKANGLVIHLTNGPTLQALTSGQIKLALVQSSAGIGAALGDKSLTVRYLDPVTILPSAIGIDAKAPAAEQAEAKKFIAFVLSPAGQKVMQSGDPTGDSLYYPVLTGVRPLPALPPLSGVQTQNINPYTWGPQEATINTWFDSNIVR
jgi:ABC-type Fe3+ transport system substrate-binding protein